jgi:hypothetical protein
MDITVSSNRFALQKRYVGRGFNSPPVPFFFFFFATFDLFFFSPIKMKIPGLKIRNFWNRVLKKLSENRAVTARFSDSLIFFFRGLGKKL